MKEKEPINPFDEDTKEIFSKAKVSLETPKAKELFEDARLILQEKMALLSSAEGLSWNRVKKYDEQKAALVDDLKNFLKERPNELKEVGG